MENEVLLDGTMYTRRPKRRSLVVEGFKFAAGVGALFVVGLVVRHGIQPVSKARTTSQEELKTTTTAQAAKAAYTVDEDAQWTAFKASYGKRYSNFEEEAERRVNFHKRMAELDELNKKNGAPIFGATRHADRPLGTQAHARGRTEPSAESIESRLRKPEIDLEAWKAGHQVTRDLRSEAVVEPGVVDWRTVTNALTPVKNQGQCGSCWAFSVAEQVEAQNVLAGSAAVELSAQQIASCVSKCDGCGGGDTIQAYEYLKSVVGLAPASYWPYSQSMLPEESCLDSGCTAPCDVDLADLKKDFFYIGPFASVDDFSFATAPCGHMDSCDHQDLESLMRVSAEMPVSVCVNAENWDDYVGGVMTADTCGGNGLQDLDHCVSLVGFNSSRSSSGGYWIVRNSWSADWGLDGYIYLQIDQNTCGLANEATVAQITPRDTAPTPPTDHGV